MNTRKLAFLVILVTFVTLSAAYLYTQQIAQPKSIADVSPPPSAPELPLLGVWEVEQSSQTARPNITLYAHENKETTTYTIPSVKNAKLVLRDIEELGKANYYVNLFEQYYIDRLAKPAWTQSMTEFDEIKVLGEDATGVGGDVMSFFAKLKSEFIAIVISSKISPKNSELADFKCPCDVEFKVKESAFTNYTKLLKK